MHGGMGPRALVPSREKEPSQAVWRSSWHLSPGPLSGIGARFRQKDQISSDSLEMRTASRLVHPTSFRLHLYPRNVSAKIYEQMTEARTRE